MKRQSGFTLIELLVVIAIIAILAAILFPIFTKAKESAQKTACISDSRQIGTAVTMYADNWNGYLPQACNIWAISSDYSYDKDRWNYFKTLGKYTKSMGVFICSGQPIDKIRTSLYGLWYEDPSTRKKKTQWYGATYTPTHHNHMADSAGWPGGCYAQKCWSISTTPGGTPFPADYNPGGIDNYWRHGLVNLDSYDYSLLRSARAKTVILFCMSGAWRGWTREEIEAVGGDVHVEPDPDGLFRGSHQKGTPALFADMHIKFVEAGKVGKF